MATRSGLISANTGIGLSAEQVWLDGAPFEAGEVSTAIGVTPNVINLADANGVTREARLIQALGSTPAGYDVIPGWFARTDVKVGQWVWCLSRRNVVEEPAIAGGKHVVRATVDMERLAKSMAEVKDEHKFEGTVQHPTGPAPRAKPFVKKAKGAT
jgi:hypothetical protein